jgi:hypothetical protein
MRLHVSLIACVVLFSLLSKGLAQESGDAKAEEAWGNLSGRFLYAGDPPMRAVLELNKDIEYCAPLKPLEQELIVDPKTLGLQNVVLWLEPKTPEAKIPVHPSYEKSAKGKVLFDNVDCQFSPHVCILRTTQTLAMGNKDPIAHNVAAFFFKNEPFNVNVPTGSTVEKQLPESERLPAKVTCPIHAWMVGYMIVKDHPYVAVTDTQGKFELKNLPAGEWTIRVWHEKPGYIKEAKLSGKPATWEAGRMTVTIKPGDNALGAVELSPSIFQK